MRRIFILCTFLFSASLLSCGQINERGYEISFTISGLQDSSVYLAYHLGEKQYIKDTVTLNSKGYGYFSGKENLPEGIYMIVMPGKNYFQILIGSDQYFSITCSYPDFLSTLKFSGSEENIAFLDYQKEWISLQQKATQIINRLQNNKQNSDSLKILTEKRQSHEEMMKEYLRSVINDNHGNLLAVIAKALLPVEIPAASVPSGSRNPDSLRWILNYNYSKDHFFDNIDLTDEKLVRTPILHSKLKVFFTNVVIQSPDSINKEIEIIISKCENSYKVFQYVSVFLFNHFKESEIMGHDAVLVKLADDIYLPGKADWVSDEFIEDLRKQVDRIRPSLIGRKGENLIMDSYKGIFVSLYDVEASYIILYFWEPDCGHCNVTTPKLRTYYNEAKEKGIEVFAVCTGNDREKWEKYITDNNLNWINGWDPERRSNFDFFYNVQSTPVLYILDRDKSIIAKKLSIDDIPSFIENHKRFFR
ncbi:MAG: redoxin domain-containing protein [Bacteroidales bacterium]|nr:redoxin domain-containing protein [Bacteroidales bacterium]